MSDFDDLDLSRRLRAAAGDDPDLASAHAAVGRRVRRVRRTRAAVLSSTAVVLLVVGTVAAMSPNGTDRRVGVADA
ncbi:MAG: hypothetical protein ACK5CE_01455, partial [Actinomycetes bacterium]